MNKKDVYVIKRDGTKELFDVTKIKKSIEFATEGQGVNALQLESSIDQVVRNGIKTSDIQDNVIRHAIQQATTQNPKWVNVAGRALAMQMWADFPLRGKSFFDIVQYNIKKHEYVKELNDFYTKEDIDELEQVIDHKRDLNHSYSSLITVQKKYLGKYELNQHMHMVSAMRFGQLEPKETRLQFVKNLYDVLSNRKISLATPFMSNLRRGGNIASCFIIAIDDDLNSIFKNIYRIAKISKNGGGLGIYLGNLRAKGSSVSNYSNAAGTIVQWIKIINDTLVAVNQGGKRAGAGTVALPIWHNDILDFLDMQTEHGDQRMKAYDVFPQVVVPDLFMQRDKEQKPWITFCPHEVKSTLGIEITKLYGEEFNKAYNEIEEAFEQGRLKIARKHENARIITKTMMRTQLETGLPYVSFIDTINRVNPNGHDGIITNVNLCLVGETEIEISTDNGITTNKIRLDDFVEKFEMGFYNKVSVKSYDIINKKVIFAPVTRAVLTSKVIELIRIESEDNKHIIECTPDHQIFTTNRGWVRAEELQESDDLIFNED